MLRGFAVLDRIAHFLHCPTRLLARICDRYDRHLGVTETEMKRSVPVGWRCPHFSMTTGGLSVPTPPTSSLCNCAMQPIYGGL